MTKKIFHSIFIVSCAVLIACLTIVMGFLYDYFSTVEKNQMEAELLLAMHGVENEGSEYLDGLKMDGYRLTWVDSDGTVIFDSEVDASQMENHMDREEISGALKTGAGQGDRTSSTLSKRTIYLARRLSDGTVLRIAVTSYTVFTILLGMIYPIIIVLIVAVALSLILSKRLSKRIVDPLNRINLDDPLENDTYEELSPLLTRITRQHRQIDDQLEKLARKQSEFSAVTDNMSEGLVLLGADGTILSMNKAAMRIFSTDSSCVGKDMLTVNRSSQIQSLIKTALSGTHSETNVERCGCEYQLGASPIKSANGAVSGAVLLIFDVTEREMAEQQRREFSANVSHELKTPLHSIMGSAELIENGLVKPEDMPRFVGRIRSEAARLVTLIDDIIRLSQLDEGGEMSNESIGLKATADEVCEVLLPAAKARGISIAVTGDDTEITGVKRLIYEIIYNLCDNAIKYNKDGGKVEINISGSTLSVSDTGIGIPKEHQARVFERFYRVDKSHSRETGGTGLGLSIVKHAAQYHGAIIDLDSIPGKGTTITVIFPKND